MIFMAKILNFRACNYQFFRARLRHAVLPTEKQVLTPSFFTSPPKFFLATSAIYNAKNCLVEFIMVEFVPGVFLFPMNFWHFFPFLDTPLTQTNNNFGTFPLFSSIILGFGLGMENTCVCSRIGWQ